MNKFSNLLVHFRAIQFTAVAVSIVALTTTALGAASVAVRVNEGVRYVPQGAPGGAAAGVVRTIDIAIHNMSDRQLDVSMEFAMFALDAKNALKPMTMIEGAGNKGKSSLSLRPGEHRVIRAEAHHAGELVNAGQSAFGKPRDLGNVVEPAYNNYNNQYYNPATGQYNYGNNNQYRQAVPYVPPPTPPNGNTNDPNYRRAYNDWYNRQYNNNNNYNNYNYRPPEIETTPKTVQRMGQPAQTTTPNAANNRGGAPAVGGGAVPATERYYGYSVIVYAGGEVLTRADKNPANLSNFGVSNIQDAPAARQPVRRR